MTRTAVDALEPEPGPMGELRAITAERAALERREEVAVRRARAQGYSWAAISSMLGISRQAAHKKFGRRT
ncbi:AsnC family protein [Serinibacter arcticus]